MSVSRVCAVLVLLGQLWRLLGLLYQVLVWVTPHLHVEGILQPLAVPTVIFLGGFSPSHKVGSVFEVAG